MTTAFQYVFDNAESISINTRPVTATTISRDATVRTTARGGAVWRFDVRLPDGIPWSTARPYIAAIDAAGRTTSATVQINNSGYNTWLTPYQGDAANPAAITCSFTQGATSITLTGGQAASGFNFRSGDVIQLGASGSVYFVTADVAYNNNNVTLNRAILDSTGTATLSVGPAVTWTVICTDLPQWSIFARDQVSWSGSFVFYEDLV